MEQISPERIRQCTQCDKPKSSFDFYKGDRECKDCRKARSKEIYRRDPAKRIAQAEAWRNAQPDAYREHVKEYNARYYRANRLPLTGG